MAKNEQHQGNIIQFPKSTDSSIQDALKVYFDGNGDKAVKELKLLVDQDKNQAYQYLGLMYEHGGNGVSEDIENAVFYYQKSIETQGSVEGYLGLARIYLSFDDKDKYCMAYEMYERVANEDNNGFAYFMLGNMNYDGQCVVKNINKAVEYYKKAWSMGYVYALTRLGEIEQSKGSYLKGWWMRLKAGYACNKLLNEDPYHPNTREY